MYIYIYICIYIYIYIYVCISCGDNRGVEGRHVIGVGTTPWNGLYKPRRNMIGVTRRYILSRLWNCDRSSITTWHTNHLELPSRRRSVRKTLTQETLRLSNNTEPPSILGLEKRFFLEKKNEINICSIREPKNIRVFYFALESSYRFSGSFLSYPRHSCFGYKG